MGIDRPKHGLSVRFHPLFKHARSIKDGCQASVPLNAASDEGMHYHLPTDSNYTKFLASGSHTFLLPYLPLHIGGIFQKMEYGATGREGPKMW